MSLLIQNGMLVGAQKSERADILISNGIIEQVAPEISTNKPIDRVIDAEGMLVLPGGVDPHVHMQLDTPSGRSSDDFRSGSLAALHGGITTLIDFVTPHKNQPLPLALQQRQQQAAASIIDHSLHVSPVRLHTDIEQEIVACIRLGVKSFKLYMAYLDTIGLREEDLEKVLHILARHGAMATVHAEMGEEIATLREDYFRQGKTSPLYHALSRPAHTEAEAVEKVIEMARKAGCPLYLVHISSADSLSLIHAARKAGQRVFAETCPQYLLLNDMAYDREFKQAAPYVISPPLRKKHDNDALWQAISSQIIQSTGTDHCPFTRAQKDLGRHDFRKIPNGAGGVEHRMALLYTYGVQQQKISLNRWVDITSTTPARIFGLFPRKGSISPGADADLVIWNPDHEQVISAASHHQCSDINIYEGIKVHGTPTYVIAGGKVVLQDGKLQQRGLRGRFLYQKEVAIC